MASSFENGNEGSGTVDFAQPKKRHFRSVWFSDLHLGSKDCRHDALSLFLDSITCDTLYLVGDIVDLWALRKKWHWPSEYNLLVNQFLHGSHGASEIVYIPGNHDEELRDLAGYRFGNLRMELQVQHVTADGRRFLVLHGDEFDSVHNRCRWLSNLGNWFYGQLILINSAVNIVRGWWGRPYWSFSGTVKRRVKQVVKRFNRFEHRLTAEATRREFDGVICGHIHQPGLREVQGMLYCNTGDWIESCSAIVETEQGALKLLKWVDGPRGGVSGWNEKSEAIPPANVPAPQRSPRSAKPKSK
ncbi:MAG: UDP-2,3-diacylglucosamine diphosphatase [Planctomycetota bacterium]